jgi:hypothetical protein
MAATPRAVDVDCVCEFSQAEGLRGGTSHGEVLIAAKNSSGVWVTTHKITGSSDGRPGNGRPEVWFPNSTDSSAYCAS